MIVQFILANDGKTHPKKPQMDISPKTPQNNGDKITSGRKYANKRLNEILITRLKWSGTQELQKKRETHKKQEK